MVYGNRFLLDIILQIKYNKTAQKEAKKNKCMAMESIFEHITDIQKKNIGKCNSAKELWLRLE